MPRFSLLNQERHVFLFVNAQTPALGAETTRYGLKLLFNGGSLPPSVYKTGQWEGLETRIISHTLYSNALSTTPLSYL